MLTKPSSGGRPTGLLLLRRKTPLARRSVAYFCSGAHTLLVMKQKEILHRRERLARELPSVAEIVRGSLLNRTIRHRRGCPKCARGEGHPVSVLTVGYAGGKNKQISLHAEQREQVERWIKNYQVLKDKLEEICELNQQLLRAEE